MAIKNRRFKTAIVTFTTPVLADFSCQMMALSPTNNTPDGAKFKTFCAAGDGDGVEESDDDWSVTLRGKADWTPGGISRYLVANEGDTVELTINFDNGVEDWDREWVGSVVIKNPGDGGDAGGPQEFEVTLQYVGKPVLSYNDAP